MQKHKPKLTSEDDEARSQKSHYTNVSKMSSKYVELSLEVEMDDEVRDIIKSPQKAPSALLDVTVIKPKGMDKYTTEKQILKTDQVKKMIGSMKLDANDKNILMKKLFGENYSQGDDGGERKDGRERGNRKSCLSKNGQFRQSPMKLEQGDVRCGTDDNNSVVYSMYNQPQFANGSPKPQQQQQIYTSPKTYENIRTMFQCTNREECHRECNKMEQPCLCQNCAIVGILTDSQKKPFATEPIPDPMLAREPSRHRRPARRKSVTFKHLETPAIPSTSRPHEHDQCEAVFRLLSSRIAELERRVAMQEEKAVPKDYFKKIITKLVTHLTKLTHYTEDKSVASSPRHRDPQMSSNKYKANDRHSKYYVNPILFENTFKVPAEKEYEPKPCSSEEPTKWPSENFWRWGEEFLSSGRDLKNKVVVMLEDTLHNLKKGWEGPPSHGRFDEDMQTIVEELSKNLAATLRPRSRSRKGLPEEASVRSRKRVIPDAKINMKPLSPLDKRGEKPSLIPRFMRKKGPSVNVSYVNPQLRRWPEESAVSFKIDSSDDYEMHGETMSEVKKKQYRKEFLKVLANTKTADKFKLWQNIWNQALENRQNKSDIVTIQIPDPKDLVRQKMIHLEYTIGELEKLLTGTRHGVDKK